MSAYFAGCATVAEVKSRYRELAKQHHPDVGGDTVTMQAINTSYLAALEALDGEVTQDDQQHDHVYHYKQEAEQAIIDQIAATLATGIIRGNVDLWLLGLWVWVGGDTKPVKETLKTLGYSWHPKRQRWYWKPYEGRSRSSSASFAQLAHRYGAQQFASDLLPKEERV